MISRFEKALSTLRDLFNSENTDAVVEGLVKGGRGALFSIEGLARLYGPRYPETMGPLRLESKSLEDRVGKLIDWNQHLDFAKEGGVSDVAMAYLGGRRDQAYKDFAIYLTDQGWVGKEANLANQWQGWIERTKWDSKKEDRRFVLESLIDLVQELRKESWDLRQLQTGLHEFRRRLRWVLIYLQSLGGLIEFDGRPLKAFAAILKDPVAKGPYGKLPPGERDKFPLLIPRETFLELTKAVDQLGFAKDMGEAQYDWLPEALFRSGVHPTLAPAKRQATTLVKKHPHYVPVFETGKAVYDHLRAEDPRAENKEDRGILVALRQRLKEQLSWSKADCHKALKGHRIA